MKNIILVLLVLLAGCGADELVGGDKDGYGCLVAAGYSYDDEVGACLRQWEHDETTKSAAGLAVDHMGKEGLSITNVTVMRCPGCFMVELSDQEQKKIWVEIDDWNVINTKNQESRKAERLAFERIENDYNYQELGGRDLVLKHTDKPCEGCYEFTFEYDIIPGKLTGIRSIESVVLVKDGRAVNFTYTEIAISESIDSFSDCADAGYEILYPDCEGCKPYCETPGGLRFEEEPCSDMCGDGTCQEIVCMASGCACAENIDTCPEDCS